jgi:hypothetical protein
MAATIKLFIGAADLKSIKGCHADPIINAFGGNQHSSQNATDHFCEKER